jgi:hypothetical protein
LSSDVEMWRANWQGKMQMNLKVRGREKGTTGEEVARRVRREVRSLGVLEFEW